ncbi:hypothetical protein [Nostoc sp.]|uniref:hypothetical protein n=1 Tax=Nostoc sp. TaxID=1180 RepID=UPI002FF71FA5
MQQSTDPKQPVQDLDVMAAWVQQMGNRQFLLAAEGRNSLYLMRESCILYLT